MSKKGKGGEIVYALVFVGVLIGLAWLMRKKRVEPFQTNSTDMKDYIDIIRSISAKYFAPYVDYPGTSYDYSRSSHPNSYVHSYRRKDEDSRKYAIGGIKSNGWRTSTDAQQRLMTFIREVCPLLPNGSLQDNFEASSRTYYTPVASQYLIVCRTDIEPNTPPLVGTTKGNLSETDCSPEGVNRLFNGTAIQYYYEKSAVDSEKNTCEHIFTDFLLSQEGAPGVGNGLWSLDEDYEYNYSKVSNSYIALNYIDYIGRLKSACDTANGYFKVTDLSRPSCVFTLGTTNIEPAVVKSTEDTTSATTTTTASTTTDAATTAGTTTKTPATTPTRSDESIWTSNVFIITLSLLVGVPAIGFFSYYYMKKPSAPVVGTPATS